MNFFLHLKFNQQEETTTTVPGICHFKFHTTVQSYRTHSQEFRGLKLEIYRSFYLSASSFFAGSGLIISDPDLDPGSGSAL